jgi:flavin reductase (DIM6/NTAB) family NADH-FMN oxidoreductase RutF
MSKVTWKPGTMLYPVPAAMVSCSHGGVDNILTISWAGTICTNPPMLSISVRPERFSYNLIKESGEFVVNLPGSNLSFAADYCGVKSGRDIDKFKELNLHKEKANKINAPLIKEAPLSIECKVRNIIELGSHHMFIADVVAVNVEEKLLDEKGTLQLEQAELICYNHGKYCIASKPLGKFGYSVERRKKK